MKLIDLVFLNSISHLELHNAHVLNKFGFTSILLGKHVRPHIYQWKQQFPTLCSGGWGLFKITLEGRHEASQLAN